MSFTKKKYMSLDEVADMLGVHYQLIYRLARSGELPAIKLGRIYRVEEGDLMRYLEESKTKSSGDRNYLCDACGNSYSSKMSVQHECNRCGGAICNDCWMRLGVRTCCDGGGMR